MLTHTQIMRRALADISYMQTAEKAIRRMLVPAYVQAFHSVNSTYLFQTYSTFV